MTPRVSTRRAPSGHTPWHSPYLSTPPTDFILWRFDFTTRFGNIWVYTGRFISLSHVWYWWTYWWTYFMYPIVRTRTDTTMWDHWIVVLHITRWQSIPMHQNNGWTGTLIHHNNSWGYEHAYITGASNYIHSNITSPTELEHPWK